MKSALAHFQTLPLKDATRQLHHAFQEGKIKRFVIHPSSFILFTMLGSTLSDDQLSDKRFDFPFVDPPYGYEWIKDYAAVTTRRDLHPSHVSLFNAASSSADRRFKFASGLRRKGMRSKRRTIPVYSIVKPNSVW